MTDHKVQSSNDILGLLVESWDLNSIVIDFRCARRGRQRDKDQNKKIKLEMCWEERDCCQNLQSRFQFDDFFFEQILKAKRKKTMISSLKTVLGRMAGCLLSPLG